MSASLDGDRDGATYEHSADYARLNKQQRRVFDVLRDRTWWSLSGIAAETGDPEASVSARLRDLRKQRFGGWVIERLRCDGGLWLYRLTGEQIAEQPAAPEPLPAAPTGETLAVPVHRDTTGRFSKPSVPDGALTLFDD